MSDAEAAVFIPPTIYMNGPTQRNIYNLLWYFIYIVIYIVNNGNIHHKKKKKPMEIGSPLLLCLFFYKKFKAIRKT